MLFGKGPQSILLPLSRGWWHGREVVVIFFSTSPGCLLCHTSILSTAPGIGSERRQRRWSRASCHGNAERMYSRSFPGRGDGWNDRRGRWRAKEMKSSGWAVTHPRAISSGHPRRKHCCVASCHPPPTPQSLLSASRFWDASPFSISEAWWREVWGGL